MHWRPALWVLLLCVGLVGLPLPAAQGAPEIPVDVLRSTSYHLSTAGGGALYYVVAEVRNPSDVPVDNVVAWLTAYRDDGSIVGQTKGYGSIPVLGPGESGPVVVLLPQARSGEVVRHELSAAAQAAEGESFTPELRIMGAERIWEAPGGRYILGELVNTGRQSVGSLTVIAGLYGAEGQLLYVVRAPAMLVPLATGDRTPFRLDVPSDPGIVSWRLWNVATPFTGHPVGLAVRVASAEPDDYGRVAVTAVVTNLSSVAARDLRAVAVLRDAQGNVVNVGVLEPGAGVDYVPGRTEATVQLFADGTAPYATVEVRIASSTALATPPGRFGTFFPIINRGE